MLNTTLPIKELSDKILEGDYMEEATIIIDKDLPTDFDDIPSLKNLQIPQVLFPDFCLTVLDCLNQAFSHSMGIIKKAKVIKFNDSELIMVVTEGKYPGCFQVITLHEPQEKYGLIGNILKRKVL